MSDVKHDTGIVSLLRNGEDIVISGIAGRFPESDSTDEFAENLFNNIDMITEDDRRWPTDLYEMNHRMGKLKNIEKFDGSYFGILGKMADTIEPQGRMLFETTFEAICDAGINPQTIRGTNTGVYIGYSSFGVVEGVPQEMQKDSIKTAMESLLFFQGTAKSMYANRLSFGFDFRGPSMGIDTACSSAMVAFSIAVNDLRLGIIDTAIVGGTHIQLQPYANNTFQEVRVNSRDGISYVWDESADGFVRGETVSCILLQRKSDAKRIYATVVHSRSNIDGHKKTGMFFPSTEGQSDLMIKVYKEAQINPNDVTYVEAHGTGTKVGDAQEARAISETYCQNRTKPLPIGLVKSSIGHGEGASGIASIVKVLISFENKCIPANLNLKVLKGEIAELSPYLFPVTRNLPYDLGIAGVNSFGVGGVNGHALLKSHDKELTEDSCKIVNEIPRLINVCGRTDEGLNYIFDFIEKNPKKVTRDFLALLGDAMKMSKQLNSSGFPYRGSMIVKEVTRDDGSIKYEYTRQSSIMFGNKRPLWFFFSGMGSQWIGMGQSLMSIDIFAKSINKSAEILKEFHIDLLSIILGNDENALNTVTMAFVSITAIQIAMIDVFNKLEIYADGIIGHSFGENACAYADGCLNHEQTLISSYWRGIETGKKEANGMMVSVGLSWDEAKKRVPKGVTVACNNSLKNVTISGKCDEINNFVEVLKSENIFVREVNCYGFAYHSNLMNQFSENLLKRLKHIIPLPKERSKNWISSSVPESKWGNDDAKFASAEYFVNNLINPVLFNAALVKHVPNDAIIVEIAPHALFGKLINQSLENATYIGMSQKNKNDTNLHTFLSSIGKLYENGVNVAIEHLYPKVDWPVSRATQAIGSLIKWDHKESFHVKKYPDYNFHSNASDMIWNISLADSDYEYLRDHMIEGRIIFPATGYLHLAWRRMAAAKAKDWDKIPVVFENVQIRRPTLFSENGTAKLIVRYIDATGEFEILESGNVACFGRIYSPQHEFLQLQHLLNAENENEINEKSKELSEISTIDKSDIYKELRVRGYDYGTKFKGIEEIDFSDLKHLNGKIKWEHNWVTFVDSLIQMPGVSLPLRSLFIPLYISSLQCDPKVLFDAIDKYQIYDDNEINHNELSETNTDAETANIINNVNEKTYDDIATDLQNYIQSEKKEQKRHSILPVVFDFYTSSVVANGIEIRNLMPALIQRRPFAEGLKLEKYEFIRHNEYEAIERCVKNEINEYIEVCGALAVKALKLNGIITHESITNEIKMADDDTIDKMVKNAKDDHILLKIFNMIIDNSENYKFNENISEKINEMIIKENMDISKDFLNNICFNERLIRPMIDIVVENNFKRELKVLEINGNNQIMAKEIEEMISLTHIMPVNVEYTIAINNNNNNVNNNNEDLNMNRYKIIEWDYCKTPFPDDITSLDLIIHRDSIDIWDLNLKSYLQSVHKSLKNGAFLLAIFRDKLTSPELAFHYLHENKNLKNMNMNHRIEEFEKNAKIFGFEMINRKSDSILYNVILFRKINKNIDPQKQTIFNLEMCKYNVWVETLKDKVKEHKEKNENENIWIIANDCPINGVLGLITCLRQEPGGDRIRCIFDTQSKLPAQIDFSEYPFNTILINDLYVNIYRDNHFGTFRHLNLPKNYDKIETRESQLNLLQRGDLSSLQWFDSTQIKIANKDMVRCNVYYGALNFRDVLIASGRIVSRPEEEFIDCTIGSEFSGRRCDNGERVYGFSIGGAFATSICTYSNMLFNIPDEWTMEDAATICTVYCTVWYGLINRGAMRKGESILIHSGAGGIGQCAIMVCQYYNCNIFTTVGTEEKRNFLKEKYNIPDDHIFSSRDTTFEEKILKSTKGRGVNIVLNSLSEDKLQASFRCLSYSGRFIELGKYDFQMNHKLNMLLFLKNISFHGVTIDYIMGGFILEPDIQVKESFTQWMNDGIKLGYVKPINRTVFPMSKAEDAFRYMLTGKHIGKLLVKIRDEESDKIILNPKPVNTIAISKVWFDPEKVYIIIGGLGGMGIELLNWMSLKGAKNFVLSSRNGIKSNYQRLILKRFEDIANEFPMLKINIKISLANVVTIEGANKLIEESESMGPIGGVFQLAMVLNDGLFVDQTIESFQETCEPKVNVTINLDKITRERCPQLDYFVVFSSVSCGRGNAGQTNYGYANSVMERICERRRNDGIHGLAIQWGPIGDVGIMSHENDEKMKMTGLMKQRINVCMHVLGKFLRCPYPIVSSYVRTEIQNVGNSTEEQMMSQLWMALGVDPKITPNHVTLGELGIESIIAVELQQRMEREYEITISISDIKKITVGDLKEFQRGNKEKIKNISKDIKKARAELSRIRFNIPIEKVIKLNEIQNGKPLYFMPPIEGIFYTFKDLVKLLKRPVYGLNWTCETNNLKDLKEIALYYMKVLKDLSPKGEYDLLGFSFGAVVAIKMLQKRAPIDNIIIVDTFSSVPLSDDLSLDDNFELFLSSFGKNVPDNYRERIKNDVLKIEDENERIKKIIQEFKDFGEKSIIGKDFDDIIKGTYERGKLLIQFKKKMKAKTKNKLKMKIAKHMLLKNKVKVIKISEESIDMESNHNDMTETYGISPQILEGKYQLETIIGNYDDIRNEIFSENINNLL